MVIPNMENIHYQQILNQSIRHSEKIYLNNYFVHLCITDIIRTFIKIIPIKFEITCSSCLQMVKKNAQVGLCSFWIFGQISDNLNLLRA